MNTSPGSSTPPLDLALRELHSVGPYLTNGFTNHAPMVLEALDYLQVGVDLPVLARATLNSATPVPVATAPISAKGYGPALGDGRRYQDWFELYDQSLIDEGAEVVLARWLPRLLHGFGSGASHGVIRTAHAYRGLNRSASDERRRELASALAYWSSSCQRDAVHVRADAPKGQLSAAAVFRRLPMLPVTQRRTSGSIVAALQPLEQLPNLRQALEALAVEAPYEQNLLSQLEAFAAAFLHAVETRLDAVVFTHALTGAAAARTLLPVLSEIEQPRLVRAAWNAGCCLFVAYGKNLVDPSDQPDRPQLPESDALISAALTSGDDHAIKLTAVCTELHRETGNTHFLAVAEHGLRFFSGA